LKKDRSYEEVSKEGGSAALKAKKEIFVDFEGKRLSLGSASGKNVTNDRDIGEKRICTQG